MSQVTVLPASEDTRALIDVHVEQLERDVIPFTNGTGSTIVDSTFVLAGGDRWCGVVQGDVDNGDTGYINVEEGILIQADDLKAGEDTFATVGQAVYFDNAGGEFSDTSTIGYFLIGYLTDAKDANGMIKFEKLRYAVEVLS